MKENYEIVNSPAHQAFQYIRRLREGYNKKSAKSKVPPSSILSPFSTIPFDDTKKSVARADLNVQKPFMDQLWVFNSSYSGAEPCRNGRCKLPSLKTSNCQNRHSDHGSMTAVGQCWQHLKRRRANGHVQCAL